MITRGNFFSTKLCHLISSVRRLVSSEHVFCLSRRHRGDGRNGKSESSAVHQAFEADFRLRRGSGRHGDRGWVLPNLLLPVVPQRRSCNGEIISTFFANLLVNLHWIFSLPWSSPFSVAIRYRSICMPLEFSERRTQLTSYNIRHVHNMYNIMYTGVYV